MNRRRKQKKSLFELRVFFLINIILLVFLTLGFAREYARHASIQKDIAQLEDEKSRLETRNLEILSVSESIQSKFFLEREGRLKHGLAKSGEKLIIISDIETQPVEDVTSVTITGVVNDEEIENVSVATRWWYFFFNHEAYDALEELYAI